MNKRCLVLLLIMQIGFSPLARSSEELSGKADVPSCQAALIEKYNGWYVEVDSTSRRVRIMPGASLKTELKPPEWSVLQSHQLVTDARVYVNPMKTYLLLVAGINEISVYDPYSLSEDAKPIVVFERSVPTLAGWLVMNSHLLNGLTVKNNPQ